MLSSQTLSSQSSSSRFPSSQGSRRATRRSSRFTALCVVAVTIGLFGACDPYEGNFNQDEEFNAGGADPYNYPPAYRGLGAVRQTSASGVFTEIAGFSRSAPVGYYSFPFAPSQVLTTNYSAPSTQAWPEGVLDPLRVSGPGTDFRQSANNPAPVPMVYNFDPPGGADPFAPQSKCRIPAGWTPNAFRDAFPLDQQWNVFTFPPDRFTTFPFGALPTWSYRPIVAEVPVGTKDLDCQGVKSERTLLSYADQGKLDVPRGEPEADKRFGRLGAPTQDRFLAWALIDPGAAVVRVGEKPDVLQGGTVSGTSVQKYGWYGQFIVAYIDGGYIPVEDGPRVAGAPTKRMRTQRLYYPRSEVLKPGQTAGQGSPGALGQGYDVLQADRFTDPDHYSPVCEIWTYQLPSATAIADLPKDEATILTLANTTLEPARNPAGPGYTPNTTIIPRFLFCLQAAPRETTP
jgi:hypothetical protein